MRNEFEGKSVNLTDVNFSTQNSDDPRFFQGRTVYITRFFEIKNRLRHWCNEKRRWKYARLKLKWLLHIQPHGHRQADLILMVDQTTIRLNNWSWLCQSPISIVHAQFIILNCCFKSLIILDKIPAKVEGFLQTS